MADETQETLLSPAEIISHMNRNAGEEPVKLAPKETQSAIPTPEPAAAAPPQPPAQGKAPEPVVTQEKKEDEYKAPDPSFIKKDEIEPTPQTKEAPEPAAPVAAEPAAEAPKVDDTVFYSRLSEMTDSTVKSEDDFVGLINHYNELLDKEEKGFEPKFSDERAKWAYQLLAGSPGTELEAAERTLNALRLKDVDKMPPKEALFNAYLQDPKNNDLSPAQAAEYFEAFYEDKYLDMDNNPLVKRNHDVDAREARQAILKIQNEFQAVANAEVAKQEVPQAVVDSIGKTVNGFGGIKLAFTDNPQENDYLTIPVTDEGHASQLQESALKPNEWMSQMVDQFKTESGNFDYEGYIQEVFEMKNHRQIRQEAYDHGYKLGTMAKINADRNQQTPKEIADLGSQAPAPVEKAGSFQDAWLGAQQNRG